MRCPVSIHMILVFLLAVLSGGCGTGYETEMEKQRETLSPYEVDGEVPPYGRNYNFIVTADSLQLKGEANDRQETVLHKRDAIVVSEFSVAGSDSAEMLWVKVARDQSSQGWISGAELTVFHLRLVVFSLFLRIAQDEAQIKPRCGDSLGLSVCIVLRCSTLIYSLCICQPSQS